MNKRGISEIIITILLVLLAIGAVVLVWGIVKSQLSSSEEQISGFSACLKLDLEATKCTITTDANSVEIYKVLVKRGSGSADVDVKEVALIFESADGEISTKFDANAPLTLETKNYEIAKTSVSFVPAYVNVAGKVGDKLCDPIGQKIECKSA